MGLRLDLFEFLRPRLVGKRHAEFPLSSFTRDCRCFSSHISCARYFLSLFVVVEGKSHPPAIYLSLYRFVVRPPPAVYSLISYRHQNQPLAPPSRCNTPTTPSASFRLAGVAAIVLCSAHLLFPQLLKSRLAGNLLSLTSDTDPRAFFV